MKDRLILGIIGVALFFGLALLICFLPIIIIWDWFSSRKDKDKQLREKAALVHLQRGSLGS